MSTTKYIKKIIRKEPKDKSQKNKKNNDKNFIDFDYPSASIFFDNYKEQYTLIFKNNRNINLRSMILLIINTLNILFTLVFVSNSKFIILKNHNITNITLFILELMALILTFSCIIRSLFLTLKLFNFKSLKYFIPNELTENMYMNETDTTFFSLSSKYKEIINYNLSILNEKNNFFTNTLKLTSYSFLFVTLFILLYFVSLNLL